MWIDHFVTFFFLILISWIAMKKKTFPPDLTFANLIFLAFCVKSFFANFDASRFHGDLVSRKWLFLLPTNPADSQRRYACGIFLQFIDFYLDYRTCNSSKIWDNEEFLVNSLFSYLHIFEALSNTSILYVL